MSELYLFQRGDNKYCYTNGLSSVSFGGDTYDPEMISCGRVEISNDVFRTNINISISFTADIVSEVFNNFSTNYTTLLIYRDESLRWAGRVVSCEISNGKATLKCESIYNSVRRLGVKMRFERFCRHKHYGDGCGIDKEDFKSGPYTISAINNNIVTIPGEPSSDSVFKFGMIYNSIDYVTIVSKSGNDCKVVNIMSLESGQTVYLYKGCNRTKTHCILLYDNYLNFGGFPWMPTSNVFEVGII